VEKDVLTLFSIAVFHRLMIALKLKSAVNEKRGQHWYDSDGGFD